MNRLIAVLLIIFLSCPFIAYSATQFVIDETEKISLAPTAIDPDSDKLTVTYTAPLNEKGEWQTGYGDVGEYKAAITVSDGITSVSEEVLIVVKKKEESPVIDSYAPKMDSLKMKEGESTSFSVAATDLNGDKLSYEWFVDGKKTGDGQSYSYDSTYNDAGERKIYAVVYDGTTAIKKEWKVDVENVDVESLLDSINDITVNENEAVSLNLPDFEKYGITYSVSEPIGDKNEWKTNYDDEGSYNIKVKAEGKGFSKEKNVEIVVKDVDRAPVFDRIENRLINENEELKITLMARDPDDDEIAYSTDNIPDGAKFEDDTFAWKPGYETVKKDGIINWLMGKFGVLDRSFYVKFTASSNGKTVVHNTIITVKDVNTAPVLEDIEPVTINEGETIKLSPKAYDLDGDRVKLSYSGFMSTGTFKSGFDDAGAYEVKVTASDGALETSKTAKVTIQQTNRAPVFGKIKGVKADEGDSIAVLLNADDPDGDRINYSVDNAPEGSSIKGNTFVWVPKFDTAGKKETKKIDLVFLASDGKADVRQIVNAKISDKNRAPRIVNATKSITAKAGRPALMFVKVVDDDDDLLSYEWNFGIFDKHKATGIHQRTFSSKGVKKVKVTVSDGTDEAKHVINVNVV